GGRVAAMVEGGDAEWIIGGWSGAGAGRVAARALGHRRLDAVGVVAAAAEDVGLLRRWAGGLRAVADGAVALDRRAGRQVLGVRELRGERAGRWQRRHVPGQALGARGRVAGA